MMYDSHMGSKYKEIKKGKQYFVQSPSLRGINHISESGSVLTIKLFTYEPSRTKLSMVWFNCLSIE